VIVHIRNLRGQKGEKWGKKKTSKFLRVHRSEKVMSKKTRSRAKILGGRGVREETSGQG